LVKITAKDLPPMSIWPEKIYTLPELQNYPEKMNSTEEFVDKNLQEGRGNSVAIYYKDQRITYRELYYTVNRLCNSLKELGIEEDDRVIIWCANIPEALVANFAIIKIGAVAVPTSPLMSHEEIAYICNNSGAKAIICEERLLAQVEAARDEITTVEKIIVINGNILDIKAKGFIPYSLLVTGGKKEYTSVLRDRQAVSLILYTSGTTGMPKGTVHFMEDLLIIADVWGKYCYGGVRPDDVLSTTGPLAFAAGHTLIAAIPFRFGASCSLIPKFEPGEMLRIIENHGISIMKMPPTAYRKICLAADARKEYDLSSLRICTSGGEAMDTKTFTAWKEMSGLDIYEAFGNTEMLFSFVVNVFGQPPRIGSPGQATPGYEIKVVDDEGNACKPHEIGRLLDV